MVACQMKSPALFGRVPVRVATLGAASRDDERIPLVTASLTGAFVNWLLDGLDHTRRRVPLPLSIETRYRIGSTAVLPAVQSFRFHEPFAWVTGLGWCATSEAFFLRLRRLCRRLGLSRRRRCLGDGNRALRTAASEQETTRQRCDENELSSRFSHDLNSSFQVSGFRLRGSFECVRSASLVLCRA